MNLHSFTFKCLIEKVLSSHLWLLNKVVVKKRRIEKWLLVGIYAKIASGTWLRLLVILQEYSFVSSVVHKFKPALSPLLLWADVPEDKSRKLEAKRNQVKHYVEDGSKDLFMVTNPQLPVIELSSCEVKSPSQYLGNGEEKADCPHEAPVLIVKVWKVLFDPQVNHDTRYQKD